MALKDHTTDSAKLSEEQIEGIISGYIKYDPGRSSVVLLPKARELPAEKRILLFLVALRGWPYLVKDNTPPESAKPAQIVQATNVPGGTVRPTLRALVDANLLSYHHGQYEAPAHNLALIAEMLSGSASSAVRSRVRNGKPKKVTKNTFEDEKKDKRTGRNKLSLGEAFQKLVDEGWFRGGKTTSQLQETLKERTIYVPMTRLPVYLIGAYRSNKLDRHQEVREGNKKVWVYEPKKNNAKVVEK